MFPWSHPSIRLLLTAFSTTLRKAQRHPRFTALLLVLTTPFLAYFTVWRLECSDGGGLGRAWWNFLVSFHPALAFVLPACGWEPVTSTPRWLDPIYEAPWMGNWVVPKLSPPVYDYHEPHLDHYHQHHQHHHLTFIENIQYEHHNQTHHKHLVSPVLVKIHIFSLPTSKAQSKRNLIRSISPIQNIPEKYRHLIEIKFVLGIPLDQEAREIDAEIEESLVEEQRTHGDLIRLRGLKNGENIREGKILEWLKAVGDGDDGDREAWFVFKMDDDTVLNLPNLRDDLLSLDPKKSYYLGTSLARWPSYQFHFTGILTGYSWPVLKTLSVGIANLRRLDIEWPWDDDVLMGELMFILPSGPQCQSHASQTLQPHCDPHQPPPWGYTPPPPTLDPRTGLIRHDFLRRAGDEKLWWIKGDIATHGWPLKFEHGYLKEWEKRIEGKTWRPPLWVEGLADRDVEEEV